jgi:5-methyltetrahydropteroyltriglutamate--homocysteine methyltransferase
MLQIDEPVLSVGAARTAAAREALTVMTRDIRIPVSLHVCGSLAGILDDLLAMPVDILDFEFARSPENLAICRDFDFGDKMVGFGCVDSSRPEIETIGQIREKIEQGPWPILRAGSLLTLCGLKDAGQVFCRKLRQYGQCVSGYGRTSAIHHTMS